MKLSFIQAELEDILNDQVKKKKVCFLFKYFLNNVNCPLMFLTHSSVDIEAKPAKLKHLSFVKSILYHVTLVNIW